MTHRLRTLFVGLLAALAAFVLAPASPAQATWGIGNMCNDDGNDSVQISALSGGRVVSGLVSPGYCSPPSWDVERVFLAKEHQMTIKWYVPDSTPKWTYQSTRVYHNYSTTGATSVPVSNNYLARVSGYQYNVT